LKLMKPINPMNSSAPRLAISLIVAAVLWSISPLFAADFDIVDQPLPGGDFNAGLIDWMVDVSPDPSVPAGTVSVVNGAARISKGGAFYAGLSQGFAAPDGLIALRLRLAELPQFGSSGSFIPEAFDIHVNGANGFSRAATFRAGASATANSTAVPAGFNLGPGVSLNGSTLRIPLSGVAEGEWLVFSASLVGASSDTATTVAIDDVVLEVQVDNPPVPRRVDACVLFNDGFETERGLGGFPRCPLGQVGDTGITACAGDVSGNCPVPGLPGQDAEYGRDVLAAAGLLERFGGGPAGFDYTKLDANGDALPQSAASWSCVRDNYTGLVWEVKVDDPADPRDWRHTYTWFEPDGTVDGGQPGLADGGSCTGSACDTDGLVTALNDLLLCGAAAWRVPAREELLGLVHAGRRDPALATEFFPRGAGIYWSGTPMAADSASAWQLDFSDGRLDVSLKTLPLKLRLVRDIDR
jgi:hypothetical protein